MRLEVDLAAKHAREAEHAGAEHHQGSRLGDGGGEVELTALGEADDRAFAESLAASDCPNKND
jgi:hypothetical protein